MASSIVEKFYSMEYGPTPEDAVQVIRRLEHHVIAGYSASYRHPIA